MWREDGGQELETEGTSDGRVDGLAQRSSVAWERGDEVG